MLDGASEAGMHAAAGNTKPGMTGASEAASDKAVQGASLSGQAAAGADISQTGGQAVSDASELVEQNAYDAVKPGEQNVSGAAKPGAKTSAEGAGTPVLPYIWAAGAALMLIYAGASWALLRRRVSEAVRLDPSLCPKGLEGRVFLCDRIASPFILGLAKPCIYLPSDLPEEDYTAVLAHERAHLSRLDHWWKPLGFAVLSVHWFNPLVWTAYVMLCRDIELACDEKVIKAMDAGEKKAYASALLSCSMPASALRACPLAFGEVAVKDRVKAVAAYRKPGFWIVLLAVAACAAAALFFLTDPVSAEGGASGWLRGDQAVLDYALERCGAEEQNIKIVGSKYEQTSGNDDGAEKVYTLTAEDGSRYILTARGQMKKHLNILNGGYRVGPEMKVVSVKLEPYDESKMQSAAPSEIQGAEGSEGVQQAAASSPVKWCDFMESGTYPEKELRTSLPEFPGAEFVFTAGSISCEKDGLSRELISGMPVWSAYFCDLNGDGLPELCSSVSLGSGLVDERIIVYDMAADISYTLADRGRFDFVLKEENGSLIASRTPYLSSPVNGFGEREGEIRGRLFLLDGMLLMEGFSPESLDLGLAIEKAVLGRSEGPETLGDLQAESHELLAAENKKDGEGRDVLTVYLMTLWQDYARSDGGFKEVQSRIGPAVLSFATDGPGYELLDYRVPREGPYYTEDIKAMFPEYAAEEALDPDKYDVRLHQECYSKAVGHYGNIDVPAVIDGLIEEIMSSPSWSSAPGDYIAAHPEEMKELMYFGDHALRVILQRFTEGGETGLKGHIMMNALNGLLGEKEKIGPSGLSAQSSFDNWLNEAGALYRLKGSAYMKSNMPAACMALAMAGRDLTPAVKTDAEFLGLAGYYTEEEAAPHHYIRRYYVPGIEELGPAAESFGFELDDAECDIDGDGTPELICNCVYGGDGVQEAAVYRRRGGVIQRGVINTELLMLKDWYNWGAGSIASRWENGRFTVTYSTANGDNTLNIAAPGKEGELNVFIWKDFLRIDGSGVTQMLVFSK
ncbi:MAG: M56 family metallopeptidase, partial [Firmicutes bacterium]|nr:M56 family metallopeptidase [Bacillota bacterium]